MPYLIKSFDTPFGRQLRVDDAITSDLMLVCTNNGSGWRPRRVLLPHQLYRKMIEEWMLEDNCIMEVACFPLAKDSFVTVWRES